MQGKKGKNYVQLEASELHASEQQSLRPSSAGQGPSDGRSQTLALVVLGVLALVLALGYYLSQQFCINFHYSEYIEDNMCPPLKKYIRGIRFYDAHHFLIDPHNFAPPLTILKAREDTEEAKDEQRPTLSLSKSPEEFEAFIDKVMHPSCRPTQIAVPYEISPGSVKQQHFDLGFFMWELMKSPEKQELLEAEFYRYDKIYSIGDYGRQLPICAVLVGKNNFRVIDKMYTSIARQNYTNFKIVHIDDNSNDGTVDKIVAYLDSKPRLKGKVTLVTQPYQRNSLYNRHFAITKFCGQEDIVLDMDADDWLIGSQVFQLVNTLYQAGYSYKGQTEETWSVYLSFLEGGEKCNPAPRLVGPVPEDVLLNQKYRYSDDWRTTHLRTYLKKLYDKMNPEDLVDKLGKQGEFYVERPDSFIQRSILELSAPKHMMVLDEFVYYYTPTAPPSILTELDYSTMSSQALSPYLPLESLEDTPRRKEGYRLPADKQRWFEELTAQIIKKRKKMKEEIMDIYYS